ncbi:MAG: NAD(P)-dependent glycerol-3-phosphate dehydrogenase [Actinobacteria bacterium]|nr:NAD(P)-dependent glycerol-3-phosphate dehydrogenase [Actinomycetota bacterium]
MTPPAAKDIDVAVVGGGSFGTTLASLLTEQGKHVRLWVRRGEVAREINKQHTNSRYLPDFKLPSKLKATCDLEAAANAPVVIMVVPSKAFREVANQVGTFIRGDQVLVHATKGLERGTFKRMSEILREETCSLKIGAISGPNLAVEIMRGNPAGAVIASHYREVIQDVQELFAGSRMRMYGGRDVVGTELGGAFKNIVAMATGVSDGMGFGDNTRALVMTRGLTEMVRFSTALGANILTFGGLAGIGDMMATCSSPLSRNYRVGSGLAQGKKLEKIIGELGQVAEGVPTTEAVYSQAADLGLEEELPIVCAVYGILYGGKTTVEALTELMSIPVGDELAALRSR